MKIRVIVLLCSFFLITVLCLIGCGGGGGGGHHNPGPITISKAGGTYDFGNVTIGSSPAPFAMRICCTGEAEVTITEITLSDTVDFYLDMSSDEPCSSPPFTLVPGSCCTQNIAFFPTETGNYSETVTVHYTIGDAPEASTSTVTLTGTCTAVNQLSVNLNQIDRAFCPDITAYVSVTDQNGYVVTGLENSASNFLISENNGVEFSPDSVNFASQASLSMSAAILMDVSNSVTFDQTLVDAMEDAAVSFVDQMESSDQAEIIKFATLVAVVQEFTTDKPALISAIETYPNVGTHTALYDAIYKGIQDAALQTTHRRAVIVLTDGTDDDGTGEPMSTQTEQSVIALAQAEGVPVFTVGVGDANTAVLQNIADATGGQFYDAPSSDYLGTIYLQLSQLLNNQYVLSYSSREAGGSGDVTVTVRVPDDVPQTGVIGDTSNPMTYDSCPP
ncbi:MAG: VWA domain-containing protein [Desulfobacterales bacterium]